MFVLYLYSVFLQCEGILCCSGAEFIFHLVLCFCLFLFFCLFSFGRDSMFWNLGSFSKDPHAASLMPCCQTSLGKDWLRTPENGPLSSSFAWEFVFEILLSRQITRSSVE